MSLTIGFDATAAVRQKAGIGRYTRELLAALSRQHGDVRFRVFSCSGSATPIPLPPLDHRFTVRALPLSDRITNAIWHRVRLPLPAQVVLGRFDLFHSPDFTLPPTLHTPTLLTVHDLAFLRMPECAHPPLRAYLQRVVPRSARRASHIIAVSENTRLDIIELLSIPPERVTTIYEGVDQRFRPPSTPADAWSILHQRGVHEPFVLAVGTLEPRKNYERLLEAYAALRKRDVRLPLVIAGGKGWMYESIFWRVRELRLERAVHFLEPDDQLLIALYQAARAFVYASLYEGFGIPPLEALACGAPVACSNASSLPEVVGDAALLFDPRDSEQIADCLERIITDEALACDLRSRGPRRAASFSWDAAAQTTIHLYWRTAHHA